MPRKLAVDTKPRCGDAYRREHADTGRSKAGWVVAADETVDIDKHPPLVVNSGNGIDADPHSVTIHSQPRILQQECCGSVMVMV